MIGGLVMATGCLLAASVAALGQPPPTTRLEPYVETRQDGSYVDWLAGQAAVTGRARIMRNLSNPTFYRMTKRAAEDEGRRRLLKSIGDISIDGAAFLRDRPDLIETIGKAAEEMEAVEVRTGRGLFMQAVMKIPLWGPSGVIQLVLPQSQHPLDPGATRASAQEEPAPSTTESFTGLVIDARRLGNPSRPLTALLPRILDQKGRVIYSAERVDQRFAQEHGLIAYATSVEASPGSGSQGYRIPRQGDHPMTVLAAEPGGPASADIIVPVEDADRILAAASNSAFLKECRVMVLMPPPLVVLPERPAPRRQAPVERTHPSRPEKPRR